jgi:replicative DNA helicase
VIVDYLQLMLSGQDEDSRQVEISNISRSLKLLAREMNVPILALSQLNRNLEFRGNKRPQLSDLRDSGSLEQDADAVMFIYRDEYYNPESDDLGIAEVNIAKQRMGPTGQVRLAYVATKSTFRNLSPLPKGSSPA